MASYPDLPDNRLIVNGVDICSKFGLILIDGYELSPPAPKTYTLDIPGANGSIDLTDVLMGDTAYENRSQTLTFQIIQEHDYESGYMMTDKDVEYIKTQVSNYLHGKAFDYQFTFDPDYTYHGRFSVESYSHAAYSSALLTEIQVTIDANPYKKKASKSYKFNAYGGRWYELESGRRKVRPTIQCKVATNVQCGDVSLSVPVGTYRLNDIFFEDGINRFYINSRQIHTTRWEDLKQAIFTPAYRIGFSTVLTEASTDSVSVGDDVLCGGYYYPVGYLDNDYLYFADRSSSKTGSTVHTVTTSPEEYTTAIGGSHAMTWSEIKSKNIYWDQLEHLDFNEKNVPMSWSDLIKESKTWSSIADTKWQDLNYTPADDSDDTKYTTYLTYDWEDL